MDYNTLNKGAISIARYLARGASGGNQEHIGLELEHFIVEKGSQALVPYFSDPATGKPGVGKILEHLAPFYSEREYVQSDALGQDAGEKPFRPADEQGLGGQAGAAQFTEKNRPLLALAREDAAVTLEPGAQLEVSLGHTDSLAKIERVYQRFRAELDPLLDEMGYELVEFGYHPTTCARDIPLIPKDRYHYMDKYFKQTGRHGICMMRATAAVQVSIDFVDKDDAVNKFRIANALGPLFSFITDNAPMFEGVSVGSRIPGGIVVPQRMARIVTWDDCDPLRCLTHPKTFDEDFGFLSYAERLLQSPAIFTIEDVLDQQRNQQEIYQGLKPFSQVIPDGELDDKTIEHILSLFFYDVRFKQYIEIRQADSMPIAYSLGFAALVKGLFYNKKALDFYRERFTFLDPAAIVLAKTALRKNGYESLVYQRLTHEWLDEMIDYAEGGLPASERPYLKPLADLVTQRTTLLG